MENPLISTLIYIYQLIEFNPNLDLAVTQVRQLGEQVKGIILIDIHLKRKKIQQLRKLILFFYIALIDSTL